MSSLNKQVIVYPSAKLPEGKRMCTQQKPSFLMCTIFLIALSNVIAVEVREGGHRRLSVRVLYTFACYGRNVYRFDIKTTYVTLKRLSGDSGVNVLLVG